MNQADNLKLGSGDVVAEAIALAKKADELRGTAISQLLAQREQIERDLKTLGYKPEEHSASGVNGTAQATQTVNGPGMRGNSRRFRGLTLAEVGKALLAEHDTLHGKEIEKLARAGGFSRGTKNFQNYLPVAFKRDGSFQNTGGNVWRLKIADQTT